MQGEYLLGIDLGTSACKVALFTRSGQLVASRSGAYPVYYPHPGWAEQDPDDWWNAVCLATKKLLEVSTIAPEEIAGIGIDGQSWAAVAVDGSGNVLCSNPIWMDTRSQSICDRINKKVGAENIFDLCGNMLRPSYSTAKIIWYRENLPEIYSKIDKVLQSNSFIAFRLTGEYSHDISQGYGMHCFDMRAGKWDDAMCEALEIPRRFLADIMPCHQVVGTVTAKAAAECGLAEGTPVVAGGLDAACGTLGAGVMHHGDTQEQGGQAGGMSICLEEYAADPRLILSFHVVPGQWILQGGTVGGGGVMRWLEQEFADYERVTAKECGKSSLEQFNEIAEMVSPGSDGLIFLPYMSGERSPIWDPNAKGVFYGLDFAKTKGHFVRACMEGVAYSVRHNIDVAESAGAYVNELRAVGGSANSALWMQIKSDITGKKLVVPYSDVATTLGAVILAGVGVGLYDSFESAVDETVKVVRSYEPDEATKEVYDKNYETYIELYESLKGLMQKTGGKN